MHRGLDDIGQFGTGVLENLLDVSERDFGLLLDRRTNDAQILITRALACNKDKPARTQCAGICTPRRRRMSPHEPFTLTPAVQASDHLLGNPHAPVTVVEYGDLECPNCKQAVSGINMVSLIDEKREIVAGKSGTLPRSLVDDTGEMLTMPRDRSICGHAPLRA